jgi:hypothetical protein
MALSLDGPAEAQATATEPASEAVPAAPAGDGSPCDEGFGPWDWICDRGSTGFGQLVVGGAESALRGIVSFVVEGAAWLLERLASIIDRSTRPDLTSGWFQGAYGDMAAVAVLGLLPFLILAIAQSVIRQDLGSIVRSVGYIPVAALGTGAAIVVVDMLVAVTDHLSIWISRALGADLTAFATGLGNAVLALTSPAGGTAALFAGLIAAGMVAFTAFAIWIELLLRQAAIYVAVLFLPLGFMAMVWPATAHWLRRLVQGLVAIILSKFVIMAVMALAATALNSQVATEGFAVVVSGAALLLLAALAPYVLLRLIPVFEAGMSSSLEGTLRRPTAAVSPHSGQQITRMVRSRLQHGAGQGAPAGGFLTASGTGSDPAEGATTSTTKLRAAAGAGGSESAAGAGGAGVLGGGAAAAAGVGAAVGVVAAGAKGASGAGAAAGRRLEGLTDASGGAGDERGRPASPRASDHARVTPTGAKLRSALGDNSDLAQDAGPREGGR